MPGLLLFLTICADAGDLTPGDVHRFPISQEGAQRWSSFATAHAEWACGPYQGWPMLGRKGGKVWCLAWRAEACYAEACWKALADAKRGCRDELQRLRVLLGDDAFYLGRMPDVPWWRFRDVEP